MKLKEIYSVLSSETCVDIRDASGGHMEQIYFGFPDEARTQHLCDYCEVLEIKHVWQSSRDNGVISIRPILQILV